METAAAQERQVSTVRPTLYLSLELGDAKWKVTSTTGAGQAPRERTIAAADRQAFESELDKAKRRFGLAPECRIASCYEAGRDGFWLDRYLRSLGVDNVVVDSSSIRIDRRYRRAKTDRLDGRALLGQLIRYIGGEREVWSVVNVPAPADEAARQPERERHTLGKERTRSRNRIKGLLQCQGIRLRNFDGLAQRLDRLRLWDGSVLSNALQAQLRREHERLEQIECQIRALEAEQRARLRTGGKVSTQVIKLMKLRAIGARSAWSFSTELFAWRQFRNRRQLGGLVGLASTPYDSGAQRREQGISKAGQSRVRTMAVEIAWGWLRYQPQSQLSQWYQRRFGHGSSRLRRIGIVALARKLLIALWRYVEADELPAGAELKA